MSNLEEITPVSISLARGESADKENGPARQTRARAAAEAENQEEPRTHERRRSVRASLPVLVSSSRSRAKGPRFFRDWSTRAQRETRRGGDSSVRATACVHACVRACVRPGTERNGERTRGRPRGPRGEKAEKDIYTHTLSWR